MAKKLTKAQIAGAEKKGEEELSGGNWLTGPGGLSTDVGELEQGAGKALGDVADKVLPGDTVPASDTSNPKPKPKPAASQTDTEKALQAVQQYLSSNIGQAETAMGEEGQMLAQQNAKVSDVVSQYLTGTQGPSAAVNAAQQAYNQAYQAGEGLNSAAYANMGAANAEYVASSPMAPLINLLTQGLGSTNYKTLPASYVNQLPQSLRDILAAYGVSESPASGSEGSPISTAKTVPGSSASTNLLNGIENLGATSVANPSSGIAAITNPATPGA